VDRRFIAYLGQVRGRDLVRSPRDLWGKRRSDCIMSIFPTICVVILAILGLGYYTVHKMTPGSFRVQTSVWRLFSLHVEIESSGMAREPVSGQVPKPRADSKAIPSSK